MPIDPVRASTDSEDGGTTTRCLPTRRKKGHAGGCHTPHPPRDEENDRERKTDDGMTHLHTHMTFANLSLIYMTQNAVYVLIKVIVNFIFYTCTTNFIQSNLP